MATGAGSLTRTVRPKMENPSHYFLLLLVAAGSAILPFSMFCSHRRIFENWAKVVSMLVCILGLTWSVIGFVLVRLKDSVPATVESPLGITRNLVGGICVGLILAILIARPYKRVIFEKSPPLV